MKWIYKNLHPFFECITGAKYIVPASYPQKRHHPTSEDYRVYTKSLKKPDKCTTFQIFTENALKTAYSALKQAEYNKNSAEISL